MLIKLRIFYLKNVKTIINNIIVDKRDSVFIKTVFRLSTIFVTFRDDKNGLNRIMYIYHLSV